MGKGSPDIGYRLPVGANDEPPKRPYRSTTREARRALSPEEEAVVRASAARVKEVMVREEEWKDTIEP